MKRLCMAVVLSALSLLAQGPNQQRISKLVTVKYANPEGLINLVRMFDVDVQVNGGMKVLAIRGLPDAVAAVETAIRQLDIAPRNVELTVHFVVGSDQANLAGNAKVRKLGVVPVTRHEIEGVWAVSDAVAQAAPGSSPVEAQMAAGVNGRRKG